MSKKAFALVATWAVLTTHGLLQSPAYASDLSIHRAKKPITPAVAYVCHRWWQWHGAQWVRTCWPAGQEPLYGSWNGPGWYEPSVFDLGWYRQY
jgi:hypothetical protein